MHAISPYRRRFLESMSRCRAWFIQSALVIVLGCVLSSAAGSQSSVAGYDESIFRKRIPNDQLTFLTAFDGRVSGELVRDKQFRKLMHTAVPDCMFHYGRDMPLMDALEMVLNHSLTPVQVRDGRYLTVSGQSGPYLRGRGFLWIDMQEGIVLGGFYFHPVNGEPTPTVAVFSKQVKEDTLQMSQLPREFWEDLTSWSSRLGVPPITTRYFITGSNRRILLEHDEDYCAPANGAAVPPAGDCRQMDAEAADIDETAAYYLDQVNYATNATAWMIGQDQIAWLVVRDNTCRSVADPLGCHIRVTREHTRIIIHRHPMPHPLSR